MTVGKLREYLKEQRPRAGQDQIDRAVCEYIEMLNIIRESVNDHNICLDLLDENLRVQEARKTWARKT